MHPPKEAKVYKDLFIRFVAKKNVRKRANVGQTNFAEARQECAVQALAAKRTKKGGGSGIDAYYPVTHISRSTAGH